MVRDLLSQLSQRLRTLIDEIAQKSREVPLHAIDQYYEAQGLLEQELPGANLDELFHKEVRQILRSWINLDQRASKQLQKLRDSPWALTKAQVSKRFGQQMLNSIRFLRGLVELSEMTTLATALEHMDAARITRQSTFKRGCASKPPWQPSDVHSATETLKSQRDVTQKRTGSPIPTSGRQMKCPKSMTGERSTPGEYDKESLALEEENIDLTIVNAINALCHEAGPNQARWANGQHPKAVRPDSNFKPSKSVVNEESHHQGVCRVQGQKCDQLKHSQRRPILVKTERGSTTIRSNQQRMPTPPEQTSQRSQRSSSVGINPGSSGSPSIELVRTRHMSLSREFEDSPSQASGSEFQALDVVSPLDGVDDQPRGTSIVELEIGSGDMDITNPSEMDNTYGLEFGMNLMAGSENVIEGSEIANGIPWALPDTTAVGALETLSPGVWVSATAIELVLDCLKPQNCRVLSSGFLPSTAQQLSQKKPLRLKDETKLWLPLHHGDHWVFGIVNFQTTTITVHDSYSSDHYEQEINSVTQALASYLNQHEVFQEARWRIDQQRQHRQQNLYDCGIFVLLFALCDAVQSSFPAQVDSLEWRQIFRYFIDPASDNLAHHCPSKVLNVDTGVTASLGSRTMDDIQRIFEEQRNKVLEAKGASILAQGRLDLIAQASTKTLPHRVLLQDELALQEEHCRAEAAAYETLMEGLVNSSISIDRGRIEAAMREGREKAMARLETSKARLRASKATIESWEAAHRACQVAHERAFQEEARATEVFRGLGSAVEGMKNTFSNLLEMCRQTIE